MADPSGPVISQYMDYALDQVKAEYSSQGVTLPNRQYWIVGTEAFDCEQAVLAVQSSALGTPGVPLQITQCDGPRTLTFTLQIIRCSPIWDGRRAPSSTAITSASVPVARDMEIMVYSLPGRFDVYQTGIVVNAAATPPQGGVQGSVGTYTVSL